MNCHHCSAETTNGLALCELCQRKATDCLESLPVYFRNLARWRPGQAGGRPVPGSREPRRAERGADDRVSRAIDEAGNALVTWARKLEHDRGITPPTGETEAEQAEALCVWLTEHLTSIATLDWCGEFISNPHDDGKNSDGIAHHERRLFMLTTVAVPGWYAGGCRQCQSGTYVVPGLIWVTCGGCGVTTFARDHLDAVLTEAADWIAPPMRIAEALVALVDTEMSVPRLHKRISKWGEPDRALIRAYRRKDADGDEIGPKRFRLGDVMDRLTSEGATRTDSADARQAC